MNISEKDAVFGLEAEEIERVHPVVFEPIKTHGILLSKPIVLIGMMGAGKSAIGRMVAGTLGVPFVDADHEIEIAANLTIPEIFEKYGEDHFRYGEKRVIARLLRSQVQVLATGGGAYMTEETQKVISEQAISVWLKADFDILWERVSRKSHRPLLHTPDPQGTLKGLIDSRYPEYAKADITVESVDVTKEEMCRRVIDAVKHFIMTQPNID